MVFLIHTIEEFCLTNLTIHIIDFVKISASDKPPTYFIQHFSDVYMSLLSVTQGTVPGCGYMGTVCGCTGGSCEYFKEQRRGEERRHCAVLCLGCQSVTHARRKVHSRVKILHKASVWVLGNTDTTSNSKMQEEFLEKLSYY